MKVALISDIHFGKFSRTEELAVPGCPIDDENIGAESLVEGFIDIVKSEGAEYIFIAGDLTSIASPLEYYYFEDKMMEISRATGIPIEKIICVTGNHDIDWNIARLSSTLADACVEEKNAEILKAQYQKIAANSAVMNLSVLPQINNGVAPFSGVLVRDEMILFAINTGWFCSPSQDYSHGKLSAEQLVWLETELKKYQNDKRTKVFLLHHHPIKYSFPSPVEDISLLEESSELLDIAGKYGVNLILHGHRHHPRAQTIQHDDWSNPISFICAGSLSVNSKHRSNGEIPNTAHIIDFEKAPDSFLLRTYEYSASTGWDLIKRSRPEIPLDSEVWLGKLYQECVFTSTVKHCLESLTRSVVIFSYDDLPECLHYMRHKELNDLFRANVPDGYIISH